MKRIQFDTPVEELFSVGQAVAQHLKKLDIKTAQDLLYHFPLRYEDFSNVQTIDQLVPERSSTVRGKINAIQNRRSWRSHISITEAIIADPTGSVKIIWFNQPYLTKSFAQGDQIIVAGKLDMDKYGLHFTNPSYEKVKYKQIHTSGLVPVYPATQRLTQRQLRYLIQLSMSLARQTTDYLSFAMKKQLQLVDLPFALQQIHFPKNESLLKKAQERLKFDELLPIQLYTMQNRQIMQKTPAPAIEFNESETKKFVASLSFILTDAQRRSAWEILKDMNHQHPMNRLLEGDVGSGKTVVVGLAVLNAVNRGFQSVVMAPTEILAQQHYDTFIKLFLKHKIKIGLLTRNTKRISGSNKSTTKDNILINTLTGNINLLVGTHTLIQESLRFKNLGLAVVDEQHRFGVDQRKKLTEHSSPDNNKVAPHFLSLTATPIPRTLALGFYGDLDISIIDELPQGRKQITTKIIPPPERKKTYEFIDSEIKKGRQAFVICPLIDPSDKLGVKSVTEEYERLNKIIFPDFKIGLLHGRLKGPAKERVMRSFLDNKFHVLVSTSVIEVGIDVPNATVMMIEGAERFGLAQLHQFRGRVGRGQHASYCFLLTNSEADTSRQRLQALVASQNGFELAEKDLEMRGPGEIYGLKQSGFPQFKIAKLTDWPIIKKAHTLAEKLLAESPDLHVHPLIQQKMMHFKDSIHWE
ncbi:ATP-dependent DNA helicase RecG [Patescibacteria group bacterium]|nr:ATP-dependent DNA helicase RecG [Patescibacteria group bacterium]MBU1890535.1 ATP-dependent DNA helicase RecG [Patescibacteria group bacterium]